MVCPEYDYKLLTNLNKERENIIMNNITTDTTTTTVFTITLPLNVLNDVKVEYCDEDDDNYPDQLWEDVIRLWEAASESLYKNGKEVRELLTNDSTVEMYVEFADGYKKRFELFDLGFLK